MTRQRLLAILLKHGLTVDCERVVTGTEAAGFRQFECGCGKPWPDLMAAREDIAAAWGVPQTFIKVECASNPDHPDHGKFYLLIDSFWCANEPRTPAKYAPTSPPAVTDPGASFSVPTYNPNSEKPEDEYAKPLATVEAINEVGIRLMLRHSGMEPNDLDCPQLVIERRAHGWAIFLHVDSGDCAGIVKIHDDAQRIALERDRHYMGRPEWEIPAEGEDAMTLDDEPKGGAA